MYHLHLVEFFISDIDLDNIDVKKRIFFIKECTSFKQNKNLKN